MFPINANRLTVSQPTELSASSSTSNFPECIKSIQNTFEPIPCLIKTRLGPKRWPKLKLNIEAANQRSKFDKLAEKTQLLINEKNIEYDTIDRGQLKSNIGSAKQTQISVLTPYKSIVTLAANCLQVGGESLAIRCQYPKDNVQAIENHLSMLMANKTPILVVLASKKEIHSSFFEKDKLPPYFMKNQKYGALEVTSKREKIDYKVDPKQKDTGEKMLEFSQYKMEIFNGDKKHSMPVIHVTNWDDGGTVRVEELIKLNRIIGIINEGSLFELYKNKGVNIEGEKKPLPVIHCKVGIGRTGVLAAAMQWIKPENKWSMEDIVLALRETGNPNMVQNESQYQQLLALTDMPLSPVKSSPSRGFSNTSK